MLIRTAVIGIGFIFFAFPCFAEGSITKGAIHSDQTRTGWFSEFALGGPDIGVEIQEGPLSNYWTGVALGAHLSVSIYRFRLHRILIRLASLGYLESRSKGTEQVEVQTSFQRLDFAAGYDFVWKILCLGVHLGTSMNIVTTRTIYRNYIGLTNTNEFEFDQAMNKKQVGTVFGLLVGTSIGLNLGRILTQRSVRKFDFEIRALGDYTRHGERDDFFAGVTFEFWPLSLIAKN